MDGLAFDSNAGVQSVGDMPLERLHSTWMRAPNSTLSTQLIKQLNPTIQKAINAHVGSTASPTIKSQAKLMALEAAKSFQPGKGANLGTHVFSHLQGLKRYAGREGMVLSIPERMALQKKKMDRATLDFRGEFGRDPSDDELASRAGLTPKEMAKLRRIPAVINEGRFYDSTRPDATPDLPAVVNYERPQKAWLNFIYHNASEKDKVILEHSFGLNSKPVLDNRGIAARLGISPAAVSQKKNQLQAQLDAYYQQQHKVF